MTTTPALFTSKEDFLSKLDHLKQRFNAMQPELEVTVRDPEMGVEGFVVVWNTKISQGGPLNNCGKGGTRILEGLKLDDIKRLARSMAEKNAAAGLPLGGAKSGLNADPESPDYETKYRRFVALVKRAGILFEDGGIFGGFGYDIGGKPPLNAQWACDELKSGRSFTGKPVEMGGTDYDREGIAGLGVAVAGKTLLECKANGAKNKTFAVQGLGAMGAAVLRYFAEYGGVLKALADPKYGGTWVFDAPISDELHTALITQNVPEAQQRLETEGRKIANDSQEVLYQPVDILFPCAVEDVLTKENAAKVKAQFIAEGANNPTTDDAHEILFQRGVTLAPDIISNPGGIIAAFVELTSKVSAEENAKTRAKVDEAKKLTIDRVTDNVHQLLDIAKQADVPFQLIGDYIAYQNIFTPLVTKTPKVMGI